MDTSQTNSQDTQNPQDSLSQSTTIVPELPTESQQSPNKEEQELQIEVTQNETQEPQVEALNSKEENPKSVANEIQTTGEPKGEERIAEELPVVEPKSSISEVNALPPEKEIEEIPIREEPTTQVPPTNEERQS